MYMCRAQTSVNILLVKLNHACIVKYTDLGGSKPKGVIIDIKMQLLVLNILLLIRSNNSNV